ncbi:MAG: septum site-determining protein MinC, partial [Aquificae bacterium]|nr:septum site-determining protein MinC [Aquificota bacterium]
MIEIKGRTKPVVYVKILSREDINSLKREIREKLSGGILRGSLVVLENPEILTEEERREIERLIKEVTGSFYEERKEKKQSRLLIVEKSLRAGQRVEHNGDVLVLGDVNRDAEVLAGGNIIVMGKLRGIAKAGLIGDEEAVIIALKMEPQLLQIGKVKAILDDSERVSPGYPEIAKVENKEIILEGIEGVERWLKFT